MFSQTAVTILGTLSICSVGVCTGYWYENDSLTAQDNPALCKKFQGNSTTNPTDFVIQLGNSSSDDFADPRVMYYDGVYYAYATNNYPINKTNVPIAWANDFTEGWQWENYHDTLPSPGNWCTVETGLNQGCAVYDPFVAYFPAADHFVMYYAANLNTTAGANPQTHCIGLATSKSPWGPFIAQDKPWQCSDPVEVPNSYISPAVINHDDKYYIVWKFSSGSVAQNRSSYLQLSELDKTGTQLLSTPQTIYTSTPQELDAEGPNIAISPDGLFFLYYVVGTFLQPTYSIHYSTSNTTIFGPYNERSSTLLQTGEANGVYVLSPGGPSFVNSTHMMFMTTQPRNSSCLEGPVIDNNVVRGPRVAKLVYNGTVVKLAEDW